ncbi:MAG: hypothetical protein ACUZ8O_11325 [Candidatus Anammoxibacter sp.]
MLKYLIRFGWNKGHVLLLTIFIGCYLLPTFLSLTAYGFGAIGCPVFLFDNKPQSASIEILYEDSKQPSVSEKGFPIKEVGSVTVSPGSYRYTLQGSGVADSILSDNTGDEDKDVIVEPRQFLDTPGSGHGYEISVSKVGSFFLSWHFLSQEENCEDIGNFRCEADCELTLNVVDGEEDMDDEGDMDDDIDITGELGGVNNGLIQSALKLGALLTDTEFNTSMFVQKKPFLTTQQELAEIGEEKRRMEESIVPELTPIVVIASVGGDLRLDLEEDGSLALKNSTRDNSKEIESLELAVTNLEQAAASLEKIEEGMLTSDAIPLVEDAIENIETGIVLIQSVIDALGEDDDGNGTMGCAGSSSLGIPQAKTMKKLMNKLRDRVESNWTAEHDYVELYNDNITELAQIVNSHPALAIRLLSERTRFMPSILLLIFGEPVELNTADVKRIDAILDAISAYASPQLEDAVDQIRSDLHSEEILSSFGISVE